MLAELTTRTAFTDPNWIFEIKFDGYRAVAEVNLKDQNRLYSRQGTSFAKQFPKIFNELVKLPPCIIDGEIVAYDENSKPSFQLLQNYNSRQRVPLQFQVFDILELKGKNLKTKPLIERKALLQTVLPPSEIIRYCDHVEGDGELLLDHIVKLDLEGMIAKKSNSTYVEGTRSKCWLKFKNHKQDDFMIVGYLHSTSRSYFKSLVLAHLEDGTFSYRGHVSGFSDRMTKEIYTMLQEDVIDLKPINKHEKFDTPVTWVKPKYLCSVRFTEITKDGILRHPVFQGLSKETLLDF